MSKINLLAVDDIQLKHCTDSAIELWFGNTLAERFPVTEFNDFVKFMQDAQRIFGIEPKQPETKIPVGYFPGQTPFQPSTGGTGHTFPYRPQITCRNLEGGIVNGNT